MAESFQQLDLRGVCVGGHDQFDKSISSRQHDFEHFAAGWLNPSGKVVLWENAISDVSALSGMTNLTYLDIDQNTISSISPLAGLNKLEYLSLNSNLISDISPLANLTNLTELLA